MLLWTRFRKDFRNSGKIGLFSLRFSVSMSTLLSLFMKSFTIISPFSLVGLLACAVLVSCEEKENASTPVVMQEKASSLSVASEQKEAAQKALAQQGIAEEQYVQAIRDAISQSNLELLTRLVQAGADVNKGEFVADVARQKDKVECLKILLTAPGVDVNRPSSGMDFGTPLFNATRCANVEAVKLLLAAPGIHVNAGQNGDGAGFTPLVQSFIPEMGNPADYREICKLLMKAPGIDVNQGYCGEEPYAYSVEDATPLLMAIIEQSDDEAEKELLAHPDIDVNRTLRAAAKRSYIEEEHVKQVLGLPGININYKDKDGRTALHHAVRGGKVANVKMFLAVPGIDVNVADKDGKTPLQCAVNEEIKVLLAAAGAQ